MPRRSPTSGVVEQATIDAFAGALGRRVFRPGDSGYDQARTVWNGMVDRRPALVVRCLSPTDVAGALRFARRHGLPVTVRGGGHSVAGRSQCDGGLTIDLSELKAVKVDPEARTARVGPGATWRDVDARTQEHGLATPGGTVSETGVAGLTLGGGLGFLSRRYGLTADNLLAAQVVTADGSIVRASESENPELLWGLRGGGAGLGVVTWFELRLHPVGPEVYTAQAFFRLDDAVDALRFYRGLTADAPDELACYALAIRVPPVDPFPEEHHGGSALALVACHCGSVDEGRQALAGLEAFGDPIVRFGMPIAYTALQQSFDAGNPAGARYYWKSQYLRELSDEAIEAMVRHAGSLPGPLSMAGLEPMGGAIGRIDPAATAFPHRDASFNFGIFAGWTEPGDDEEVVAAARAFHEAIAPYGTGGTYANYRDRDDAERTAYGANYDRLKELRAQYDPDGLFDTSRPGIPPGAGYASAAGP